MPARPTVPEDPPDAEDAMSFAAFLENVPPNEARAVKHKPNSTFGFIQISPIQLHCSGTDCDGTRFFDCDNSDGWFRVNQSISYSFLRFRCRHCRETDKTFAVAGEYDEIGSQALLVKLGELPAFSPHVPSRVLTIVGPDQAIFQKGRRAEALGLGIAAHAYYRRVVENQKARLFAEVVKVAEKLGLPQPSIEKLKRAQNENQFSKAIDMAKDALPDVLKIDGHNPLTLLHDALSEGIHESSDEECLERATSIRMVLAELCDRIGTVLKEQAQLKAAVNKLLARNQQRKIDPAPETTS